MDSINKNHRYHARSKTEISSLVYYNVTRLADRPRHFNTPCMIICMIFQYKQLQNIAYQHVFGSHPTPFNSHLMTSVLQTFHIIENNFLSNFALSIF